MIRERKSLREPTSSVELFSFGFVSLPCFAPNARCRKVGLKSVNDIVDQNFKDLHLSIAP